MYVTAIETSRENLKFVSNLLTLIYSSYANDLFILILQYAHKLLKRKINYWVVNEV